MPEKQQIKTKDLSFTKYCFEMTDTVSAYMEINYKSLSYENGFHIGLHVNKRGNSYECFASITGRDSIRFNNKRYFANLACYYTFGESLTESQVDSIIYQLKENTAEALYNIIIQIGKKTDYEEGREDKQPPKPYSVGQSLEIISNGKEDGEVVIVEAVYNNQYGIYYDVRSKEGLTFVMPHHSLIATFTPDNSFFFQQ